jgi:hypothetical protein
MVTHQACHGSGTRYVAEVAFYNHSAKVGRFEYGLEKRIIEGDFLYPQIFLVAYFV